MMLQQMRLRLEEWDAKQRQWELMHIELANTNERVSALTNELSQTKQALTEAEARPPVIVTETVTEIKVRSSTHVM